MGEWIKRLLARLLFWRKPKIVAPKPPTEIIGAQYLEGYQDHYRSFQGRFLSYIRENPDPLYWYRMSIFDIACICGDWSRTEYKDARDRGAKIRWWLIDGSGKAIDLKEGEDI